eukprot:CAMPEP_0113310944 /NCGR_PEP_ID=MMETSP0010_2-20120614/8386_1 /TAXON_ID=216773 ORGANISM="Corethron hystrix, Strain 308" /NCGR_SAMPLE_ID=MMETSP0010_2 /ASSEMBLY_ACC=CAM_ASM_000155 /LENGTH=428 /DNA_ID=CAMNT_0000166499 /DNA_START=1465 /DNA_END=2751 /DNA_ORIENTATION=+ /assembly_acc=CAM_ASM_000155
MTRNCLMPTFWAETKALATLLEQQVSSMPSNFSCFESVRLRLSFGNFLVLNTSEVLPETQTTLSIRELHESMLKCGQRRKNWQRADPQYNEQEKHDPIVSEESENIETKKMDSGYLGEAKNRCKRKENKRKNTKKKTGISTSFVPTFDHDAGKLFSMLQIALESVGYSLASKTKTSKHMKEWDRNFCSSNATKCCKIYSDNTENENSFFYSVSVALSRGYEINGDFVNNLEKSNIPIAFHISERYLNWVSFTALGNSHHNSSHLSLPDIRFRLQTTIPISDNLRKCAFGHESLSPVIWKESNTSHTKRSIFDWKPEFVRNFRKGDQTKVLYIRRRVMHLQFLKEIEETEHLRTNILSVGNVTWVQEYQKKNSSLNLDMPLEKVELTLEFHCSNLFQTDKFALAAYMMQEAIRLSDSMRSAGVIFGKNR